MRYRDLFSEEEVPANAVGSGQVAGVGVGPEGEPGVELPNKKKRPELRGVISVLGPGGACGR